MTDVLADLATHYRGRRILVTGHTGFKGGWLTVWLRRLGARVTGVALPPATVPALFTALQGERLVDRHVLADVRALDHLRTLFQEERPDMVLHLAAQAIVRTSYEDPVGTVATNVLGTTNLLECVRMSPSVRAVVLVTSDKCYENLDWPWGYRENDRLGGHDLYAASKAAAELVAEAYRRSFLSARGGLGLATVRAGNVVGGGDWAEDRIVPDCVRALTQRRRAPVRRPEAVRPWQHVLEPLGAYLLLGVRLLQDPVAFSGPWNIGPGDPSHVSVARLVQAFLARWGEGDWEDLSTGQVAAPHEARTLTLNCDKARRLLGWAPRWDLDRTVGETAEWYRAWYDGVSASDLCQAQIEAYERSAIAA